MTRMNHGERCRLFAPIVKSLPKPAQGFLKISRTAEDEEKIRWGKPEFLKDYNKLEPGSQERRVKGCVHLKKAIRLCYG